MEVDPLKLGTPPSRRCIRSEPRNYVRFASAPNTLTAAAQAVSNSSAKGNQTIGVPATHQHIGGAIHVGAELLSFAERQVVVEPGGEAVPDVPGGAGITRNPVRRIGGTNVTRSAD